MTAHCFTKSERSSQSKRDYRRKNRKRIKSMCNSHFNMLRTAITFRTYDDTIFDENTYQKLTQRTTFTLPRNRHGADLKNQTVVVSDEPAPRAPSRTTTTSASTCLCGIQRTAEQQTAPEWPGLGSIDRLGIRDLTEGTSRSPLRVRGMTAAEVTFAEETRDYFSAVNSEIHLTLFQVHKYEMRIFFFLKNMIKSALFKGCSIA